MHYVFEDRKRKLRVCLIDFQNLSCQRFDKTKVGQKICHRFGKPNVRVWQVLVANQILAKIMTCQIFGMANFGSKPIKPIEFVHLFG